MPYPLGHGGSMHEMAFERVVGYYLCNRKRNHVLDSFVHIVLAKLYDCNTFDCNNASQSKVN